MKAFQPFTMKNVRRLPIVGDVHYTREVWPSTELDWSNLFSIDPLPIKLSKLVYSVNEEEQAFDAISLIFRNQEFKAYDFKATESAKRVTCSLPLRKHLQTIKIKQRNTPEGVSKICGIWLITTDGTDAVKIDLCEGLGSWRTQKIERDEYIIGFHYYVS